MATTPRQSEARRRGEAASVFDLLDCKGWNRRRCGNVGISAAVGEISKGLVERGGSLLLAFHAFHSPAISTARAGLYCLHRVSNSSLIICIRRAASVSLIADACPCSIAAVMPSFKYFSQLSTVLNFS